jgi:hypothetical protein
VDGNQDGYTWDTSYYSWMGVWPHPPGAQYDDNANYWASPGAEAMISAPMDFSMYAPGDRVFLQFLSVFRTPHFEGEYATLAVQARRSGQWGAWDTLWGVINRNDSSLVQISLAHLAGAESIRVAFTFTDTAGTYGWGWGVDDIMLGHESPYPPLVQENFEASCGTSAPPGWSTLDANGDGHSWWVGFTSGITVPNSGSCYAYYRDDYGTSTPAGEDWLLTPPVSVSGKANLALSYDIGINFSSPVNESVFVELRTHDGISWGTWEKIVRYGGSDLSTHVDLDLSGMLPVESVQVAFVYADYDGGYHRAVGVDNVVITAIDTFDVDVATTGLLPYPDSTLPRIFVPSVITKNTGRTQQSYRVHFSVLDTLGNVVYEDSSFLMFRSAGQVDTTTFPEVDLPAGMRVIRKAWTSLSTDAFSFNDTLIDTLTTSPLVDLQVDTIRGYAYGDPALPATFSVSFHNLMDTLLLHIPLELSITDLTAGSTLVYRDTVIMDTMDPYASATLDFPPFQPPNLDHTYLLRATLSQSDDNPANDTATKPFSTLLAPFGEVLAYAPSPFSPKIPRSVITDITFSTDQQRFYLLRTSHPGEIWAFQPETNQFSLAFTTTPLQMGIQEESRAITWWPVDPLFWVVQEGLDTSGQRVYLTAVAYDTTGTPTGAQLNLDSLLQHPQRIVSMTAFPPTWTPGGREGGDLLILGDDSTGVQTRWTLHLQPLQVLDARPTGDSLASIAYLARGVNWTLYSRVGASNRALLLTDSSGTVLDSVSFMGTLWPRTVAFWERTGEIGQPGAHMKALITDSYDVYILSLGHTWGVVGIAENLLPPRNDASGVQVIRRGERVRLPFISPHDGSLTADLYDAMGRHVARIFQGKVPAGSQYLTFSLHALRTGVYHLHLQRQDRARWIKVLVLP